MSSVTSPTSSRTISPAPLPPRTRANRAALRDYYGLKSAAPVDATPEPSPQLPPEEQSDVAASEFDTDSFDPDAYVRKVLTTKHLDEILRIENSLIGEIKSLDGEKKALVYDNYSKLITATDTIRNMRDNMGPLMPEDSSLNDDITHIAQTAERLAMKPQAERTGFVEGDRTKDTLVEIATKKRQLQTVEWVLGAPKRLGILLDSGKEKEAQKDWNEVKQLLDKWKGVDDVEEVKTECEKVMSRV